MKKTLELLKDKRTVRKALKSTIFAAPLFLLPIIVMEILGIEKWRTYDVPPTLKEFLSRIPLFLGLGIAIAAIVFLVSLHFKEEPVVICSNCLSSYYEKDTENNKCVECNSNFIIKYSIQS